MLQPDYKTPEVPEVAYRFRQASQIIALLVVTLGVVVLCGWAFHAPTITYIRPTFQSMKVNTALAFLLLGAGLWLAQNDKRQRSRRILGLLVVVIAGLTLAEYAFHVSLGIDQVLFRDTRTPSLSAYRGRMGIATAICFLLLGLALTSLGIKKAIALQRALVGACLTLSLVALCGYLYGVKPLYSITSFSTMGLHTASGLFAVCLAYFLARTDEGIVSIAVSDSKSGFLLRTLLPPIIGVPILIGWLRLAGERANLYDTPFGAALSVLGSIGCLTAITVLILRSMHRLEGEQSRAEQAMTRKLVEAQEQERARIARELHDDISQRLALLAVELDQLQDDPSGFRSRVQELRKHTGEISNGLQDLAHDLHSSALEFLGVVVGMNSWCREFGERRGMQIDCRHDVRSTLPREIGLCVFRVLQEALQNAAKHSGVKRIEVQLHENSGKIHLIVRDSGRGFDVEAAKQREGLGLTSMRERVRLVNGTIAIKSKPMCGTTIHVRVPFDSEHGAQQLGVSHSAVNES